MKKRFLAPVRFLRLDMIRYQLSKSLFFVPFLLVTFSLVLSQVTVWFDRQTGSEVLPVWFESTVESSRAILPAIAGGTITAASIVFSLTLVAVQLAASQFSPRLLRGFLSDRFQQVVMGTVVGTFSYSLFVLREVRKASEGSRDAFLPQVSITVALVLAVLSLIAVLASIDHTAKGLRVGKVADDVLETTLETVRRLFELRTSDAASTMVIDAPGLSPGAHSRHAETFVPDIPPDARIIEAPSSGWVTGLQAETVCEVLPEGATAVISAAVGIYVVRGTPIAYVWSDDERMQDEDFVAFVEELTSIVRIEASRTMQQDVAFGILQLNDIALRALSPGVNDPNTANEIVVRLGAVVTEIYRRDLASAVMRSDGKTVIRSTDPTYGAYVDLAFEPTRRHGRNDPRVLEVIARTIHSVIDDAERRFDDPLVEPLLDQIRLMESELDQLATEADRERVQLAITDILDRPGARE